MKAAVLPEGVDLETVRRTPRTVRRSLEWLNEHLAEILSVENAASVVNDKELSDDYTEVALCAPGPLEDGAFIRPDLQVPKQLREVFQNFTDRPVKLYKDADAWNAGALLYSELSEKHFSLPVVAFLFGTGGDNSDFVAVEDIHRQNGIRVKSFWSRRIAVDPDFVPLLGLHRLALTGEPRIVSVTLKTTRDYNLGQCPSKP